MQSLPRTGMMASLLAGEADVAPVVERYRDRVAIAAINGPESSVISGESAAVGQVLRELESRGIKCKPLNVSNSFHSPLVEPVLEEFAAAARRIQYHAPQVAQFSSMRLEWVNAEHLLDAEYWP
jgi:acyl transferase domain-containing protein